jgi:1,4-alpha-glucan branching enzyme
MSSTTFGAFPSAAGVKFSVWTPEAKKVELVLFSNDGTTESKKIALQKDENGIFRGDIKVHHSPQSPHHTTTPPHHHTTTPPHHTITPPHHTITPPQLS